VIAAEFFQRDPLTCARELIGSTLVWEECAGIIVETEAYCATGDEACHTFARPSARDFIARHAPGAAYVYFNYGMYWLLNVLVKGGSMDGFVLLRALEPVQGLELMRTRRSAGRRAWRENQQALCSGPGKLTIALGVDGRDHGRPLCTGRSPGFLPRPAHVPIAASPRIGISRAADLPWRFTLRGSAFTSRRSEK
jgi:DNA-3-methyladenine glycosylase